eukprot:2723246-Prorocentrum_lima.AAC.1
MIKQQLRHIKEAPPTRKELVAQQDDHYNRKEEFDPASGGLMSVPVSGEEVADSKGEALIGWTASINSEMQNFQRLE